MCLLVTLSGTPPPLPPIVSRNIWITPYILVATLSSNPIDWFKVDISKVIFLSILNFDYINYLRGLSNGKLLCKDLSPR